MLLFFFFQAEDGIRDFHVTGVQTCALPILTPSGSVPSTRRSFRTGSPSCSTSSRASAPPTRGSTTPPPCRQEAGHEPGAVVDVLHRRPPVRRRGRHGAGG